jgi:hypothetical protein
MVGVRVKITKFVDPAQPGFVECELLDAFDHISRFVEKVPVVTNEDLDELSAYPRFGVVACVVEARSRDAAGREIVRVDTSRPWAIESVDGRDHFEVFADQIVEWSP